MALKDGKILAFSIKSKDLVKRWQKWVKGKNASEEMSKILEQALSKLEK